MKKAICALTLALLSCSCGDSPNSPSPEPGSPAPGATRTYNLAFTPFPYVLNQAALDYTYSRIGSDADMIAHHLGSYGVPWPEALADSFPYNARVMSEWETRRARTRPGHRVYLALNPMSQERNGVSSVWDATGADRPLQTPWNGYALNDPQVKIAFLNYARRAITYFNPDYVTLGIEVNQMMVVAPSLWPLYVDLHRVVYQSLKSIHPALPIMVSLDANHLLGYSGVDAASQVRARTDIAPYSDYFCLSLYLYTGSNAAGSFPADAFDRLAAMTSKPIAICETGYPSQGFTLRKAGEPVVRSSPQAQSTFVDRLFQAADRYSYRFIVHFFLRDLDESLDFDDIIRTFRYVGLYDSNGNEKPAFARWKQKLALGRRALDADQTPAPSLDDLQGGTGDPGTGSGGQVLTQAAGETSFVYANDNLNGPNTVSAFTVSASGALTKAAGSPFQTGGTGTGLWRAALNDIVAAPQGFLYVANHHSGDISVFSIDSRTGSLAAARGVRLTGPGWAGGAMALAVDPAGRFLAAGNSAAGTIATFRIARDGSLAQQAPATAAGGRPTMLKVSPDGRFMAVTLESDGRIAIFGIGPDGTLAAVTGSPFIGRSANATSVDFGCGNGLLYAGTGALGNRASPRFDVFRIDGSGALDSIAGSPLPLNVGLNGSVVLLNPARGLLFGADHGLATTASGAFMLTANYAEAGGATPSIAVFAVAPDGALLAAPGSPFGMPGSSLTSLATFPPPRCLP